MTFMQVYKSRSINSLYILKFFAACLIVLIHVPTIKYLLPISRLAVPCFFMISGFFLYDQDHLTITKKIKKAIKKILIISIKIHIVYLIVVGLFNFYYDGNTRIRLYDLDFWAKLLLYGESIPFYKYGNKVFWYLTAYIETLIIIYYFNYKGWLKYLFFLIPVGLLANLFFGRYSFLFGGPYSYLLRCNFFTMGTPFVLLGMMLKRPSSLNSFMSKTDNKTILLLTIAALFISVIEYYYQANILHLRQIGDLNLFTIPAAIGIMMIALKNQDVHPKAAVLVYLGKYSSTKIYLYHLLIYFSLNFLYLLTHHRFLKVINGYFGVLFLSIIISLLFHFTEAKLLKANTSSYISK